MQLLFILAILFAVAAISFAIQNNAAVTVMLGYWQIDSTLAVVLLASMAIGALIMGLISTPRVIAAQWDVPRLRRQIARLEERNAKLEGRLQEMGVTLAQQPIIKQPVVNKTVAQEVTRPVPVEKVATAQPAMQPRPVERRFDRLRTLWS